MSALFCGYHVPQNFRARSSLVFGGITIALAAIVAVASWLHSGGILGPCSTLIAGGLIAWLLFFAPKVILDDTGVHIHNPFRTADVPWAAIEDISTQYHFATVVAGRRWYAFALPAPGSTETVAAILTSNKQPTAVPMATKSILRGLPARPADAAGTPTGAAAGMARGILQRLEVASPHGEVVVRWEPSRVAAGVALLATLATSILHLG